MSEVQQIPIPLANYFNLIHEKKSPYYDLILYIISDMEREHKRGNSEYGIIYTINPRKLKEEIDDRIPSKKVSYEKRFILER